MVVLWSIKATQGQDRQPVPARAGKWREKMGEMTEECWLKLMELCRKVKVWPRIRECLIGEIIEESDWGLKPGECLEVRLEIELPADILTGSQ